METLQRTANRGSVSTGYDIDNSCKFEHDNAESLNKNQEESYVRDGNGGWKDLEDEARESVDRFKVINDSLDSFFSVKKKKHVQSMPSTPRNYHNYLYGEITQLMLAYVRLNPGCRYTDINRFKQEFIMGSTWDAVSCRGNFSHHCENLREPKVRRCDKILKEDLTDGVREQWIEKVDGLYYYRENC